MKPCEVCGLRECNHRVPADLKEEIGDWSDYESAARADYYARLKKTVFVPIEVEYHEPTDVIYSMSANGEMLVVGANKYRELCFTVEDVERVMRDNPVRKIIEAEIHLWEAELQDLIHQALSSYELKVNEDSINGAIRALKLLANKF